MDSLLPGLNGAPNVHPIFVHFPVALWPTALLFLTLGVIRNREDLFGIGRLILYLGTASALLALATGFLATQEMGHDAPGHDLVHLHRDWMVVATSLSVLATIFAVATRRRGLMHRWILTGVVLVAILVATLGADRGAQLVFRYGIGTAGEPLPTSTHEHQHEEEESHDGHHDVEDQRSLGSHLAIKHDGWQDWMVLERGCGGGMARPLRIEYGGAVYHVASRGNARQKIFLDDLDREAFLKAAAAGVTRYGFIVHAYCLMDNHYHLVIETPKANLSLGMQRIDGEYTQRFNRRHERCGHLFQGRFKAVLVEKESHLLEVCRYVVLNPVRAKMVNHVGDWAWSSYLATGGDRACPGFLSTSWVLAQFHRDHVRARRLYKRFVAQGLKKKGSPFEQVAAQMVLGTTEYVEEVAEKAEGKRHVKEHPRFQRMVARPALEKIVSRGGTGRRSVLAKQVWAAHVVHGYTLIEIAKHLGVHYATAGRLLKLEMNNANAE